MQKEDKEKISQGGRDVNNRKLDLPRSRKRVDPGSALVFIYILALVSGFLLGSLAEGREHKHTEHTEKAGVSPDKVQRGELLIFNDSVGYIPAPQLSQNVTMKVSGFVNRVSVKQEFANTSEDWVEALYVFPLRDESSVDQLRMRIGERVVEGKIMEK